MDDTGAGNAHVDHAVGLTDAVERACHERIILYGVAEHHQLGRADAVAVSGELGALADHLAHHLDGVHIDARLGRAHVDRGTDVAGLVEGAGNGADQLHISCGEALLHQCREATDEVDTHGVGSTLQSVGIFHRITAGDGNQHRNGGHGNALIDNRHAVLRLNILACFYEIACTADDLIVDLLAGAVNVAVSAIQQRDTHGDGADIEIFLPDHIDGF